MEFTDAKFEKALEFAAEKHNGQCRKGGEPYITHPLAVAQLLKDQGYSIEYQIAGLFHDLLEDTDATEAELEQLGSDEICQAVKLLTKYPGYVMSEYIAGIRANKMAFAVKAADRLHNLRCSLTADREFRERYIEETQRWYMDFLPEIPQAVQTVINSLNAEEDKL